MCEVNFDVLVQLNIAFFNIIIYIHFLLNSKYD